MERFPYAILYRVYPGLVYVVAIMHAKQNPAISVQRPLTSISEVDINYRLTVQS